jgi:hypothetical protein
MYIGYPPAALLFFGHPGEGVIVGSHVGDDGFLIRSRHVNILGVEKRSDAQLAFRHVERVLEIPNVVVGVQPAIIDNVRSVGMNQSVESHSISPGPGEILNVDVLIAARLALTPQQQRILGGFLF